VILRSLGLVGPAKLELLTRMASQCGVPPPPGFEVTKVIIILIIVVVVVIVVVEGVVVVVGSSRVNPNPLTRQYDLLA